jgi:hypothetical protein
MIEKEIKMASPPNSILCKIQSTALRGALGAHQLKSHSIIKYGSEAMLMSG